VPLIITISPAEDHPMRKRMRANKGSAPHAGYEAARKPPTRNAEDVEDRDAEARGTEDRDQEMVAMGARTAGPAMMRRTTRGARGRWVAKKKRAR
jgi:hypothetical protein